MAWGNIEHSVGTKREPVWLELRMGVEEGQ